MSFYSNQHFCFLWPFILVPLYWWLVCVLICQDVLIFVCGSGGLCGRRWIRLRSSDGRRWSVPLRMVTWTVRGCWSMPAPTRRPRTMCVGGRCLIAAPSCFVSLSRTPISYLLVLRDNFFFLSLTVFKPSHFERRNPGPAFILFLPLSFVSSILFLLVCPLHLNFSLPFAIEFPPFLLATAAIMCGFWSIRLAVRIDGADACRCGRPRGLHAAADRCRRR